MQPGCYAQVNREELEEIEEIDLILGTNEKNDIIDYVERFLLNKEKEITISDVMEKHEFLDFGDTTYTEKTRAVIKVQDGCDRFCTYCIIPYARGRVRSRKPESIISEIKKIAEKDIKEVVLTGIHIASYGKDFKDDHKGYSLIDLLEEINNISGIERIRLGSLEPTLITTQFINRLIKLEKVCDHFHLSMQSGSNKTLERMNRRYTKEDFKQAVDLIRENYKEVAITTDIIVGFPGETDEEFEETLSFIKSIKFYKTHIFKYSKRDGTKAAIMKDQVPDDIKEKRSKILIELSDKNEQEILDSYIGKKVKVLFEEMNNGVIKGYTNNYIMVKVMSENDELCNDIEEIHIKNSDKLELIGAL